MKYLPSLLTLTALGVLSAPVSAAGPTADDPAARAQSLFDQALAAARKNDFKAACPLFRASQDADPKTSTLLNLGTCYERNFQTASAWAAFRAAESSARNIGRADLEDQARSKIAQIEPSLVRLTIEVPPASRETDLVVRRDGTVVDPNEWQIAIPVDPGEHVVTASAPRKVTWEVRTLVGNESRTVRVPVLQRPAGFWTVGRKIGVGVGAAGLAALATGLVVGVVGNSNYRDARDTCKGPGPTQCDVGSAAAESSARGLETAATVLVIGGAVAAAGGAALVLFARPRRQVEPKAAALVLHATPAWLGLSGRF